MHFAGESRKGGDEDFVIIYIQILCTYVCFIHLFVYRIVSKHSPLLALLAYEAIIIYIFFSLLSFSLSLLCEVNEKSHTQETIGMRIYEGDVQNRKKKNEKETSSGTVLVVQNRVNKV